MKTLKEYIADAEGRKKAIAHFNVANSDMLMATFDALREVSTEIGEEIPLVFGVTGNERAAFGEVQFVDYVASLRNEHSYPVFTNADHTYSVEATKSAIDAGFDMVIYDGNKVSHVENVENTKEVVAYKNEINPECLVEAEFGFIGGGSDIKDEIPEGISDETMTNPDEALNFVTTTGIDLLAPSVGNVHGMVKTGNPALNPERISDIRNTANVPLVLHGGSGVSDDDFKAAIDAGIAMIHISTELRVAYKKGLEEGIAEETLAPYKYSVKAKEALKEVAKRRIRLFWRV